MNYEDNALAEQYPKGVPSKRHACVGQVQHKQGAKFAALIPPTRAEPLGPPKVPRQRLSPPTPQQKRMNLAHTVANNMPSLSLELDRKQHVV